MLSKNQLKLLNSLKKKNVRQKHKLFVAEGIKVVEELLNSNYKLHTLFCTSDYSNRFMVENIQIISEKELNTISEFNSPNKILAIFEIPENEKINSSGLTVVLDEINDPGNLGTIIRLCDWFDVNQLICSSNTVDCYNKKVVQASMGSLSRVSILYLNINKYLENEKRTIYGAFLEGENIYQTKLNKEAVLVLGNEANGISNEISKLISNQINIPQFGDVKETESLNVATATAILLSEFKRYT
jgi:RNA methyltransferase, TrmH family